MSSDAVALSRAPSAMVPAAASSKCSTRWSGDMWLSAPSHTDTPTTRTARWSRAISSIRRIRPFISVASCMGLLLAVLAAELDADPPHHLAHRRGCRRRQRRAGLEVGAFDRIDDAAVRQLAQRAGQLDGFMQTKAVGGDPERGLG